MLKQILVILSLIQIIHCLAIENDALWNRRNIKSQTECELDLSNENPSLQGKICGYCFAKCQQHFGYCLLAQLHQVATSSIDYCNNKSKRCEENCLNDKRTSRVAEANWWKVVEILREYRSLPSMDAEEKH